MASASRHIYLNLIRISGCTPAKRKYRHFDQFSSRRHPFRQFTSAPRRFADRSSITKDEEVEELDESEFQVPAEPMTPADLDPTERATYDLLSKDEQKKYMAMQNHVKAVFDFEHSEEELDELAQTTARELARTSEELDFREVKDPRALNDSFWAMDEDDEFGQVEDDDDERTDGQITSVAESELELHREIREYYRLAAWELPLLAKYAKAFTEPTFQTPLRFRYTTYMGENHPAQKKVVVEFNVAEMKEAAKLTASQEHKLKLLAGARFNPEKGVIKMSCEKFENAAQNKRYLGELVGKLINESKNESDMFEDVPLDLRHHKWSERPKFPEEWLLNDSKGVGNLLEKRQELKLLPEVEGKDMSTTEVNGRELVNLYVKSRGAIPAAARLR